MKLWSLAIGSLLILSPSLAAADVRVFNDQGSFLAALDQGPPGYRTADFDDLGNAFYGGGAFGPGEVTYNGITVRSTNSYVFSTANGAYGTGTNLTIQQATPTDFEIFTTGSINAFGMNIAGGAPLTITFGGETITLPISQYPTFSYVGLIISDFPSGVTVHSDGAGVDLDDVTFGTGDPGMAGPQDLIGGTPDDPNIIAGGTTDVGGHISGEYPGQSYVGFDWTGGDFSALGSLTGADPNATFDFSLFARDDITTPLASISLNAANNFSGFLNQMALGAGSYAIGFATTSPFDPDWTIRFADPVASSSSGVPEPATWAMMIFGMGLVGGLTRRRPQRGGALAA